MINQDKWIDSLHKTNIRFNEETNQIDHHRWINTISKKKTYNTVRKYSSVRKYTLMTVIFYRPIFLVMGQGINSGLRWMIICLLLAQSTMKLALGIL